MNQEGNARPPSTYKTEDGYSLGAWVSTQRTAREQLSQERIKRLNALGFVWDVSELKWEEGFGHLQAYVEQEGNARPPSTYKTEDGYSLGAWVSTQRTAREQLSQERIKRLGS